MISDICAASTGAIPAHAAAAFADIADVQFAADLLQVDGLPL